MADVLHNPGIAIGTDGASLGAGFALPQVTNCDPLIFATLIFESPSSANPDSDPALVHQPVSHTVARDTSPEASDVPHAEILVASDQSLHQATVRIHRSISVVIRQIQEYRPYIHRSNRLLV